jgi:hypothetical protein
MASRNIEKTRARLQQRIAEGSYYEAHQQIRVLSQRYTKAKNYNAAIEILRSGAQSLLKAGQTGSGADVCLLLVEVYKNAQLEPTALSKSRLFELISMLPAEEPSRKRFINESVVWTCKFGQYPAGDPELHHFVGNLYAQEDEVAEAERHLLLGSRESADVLANFLYEWYQQDQAHTAPLYAARAVLPYLLIGNLRDASRSLEVFTRKLLENNPSLARQEVSSSGADLSVLPSLPLLNYLSFLVLAVQKGGADVFRTIRAHYTSNLKETPTWDEALEQIGEMYFGIPVKRGHNLFDMMGSLFGGSAPQLAGSDQDLD